MQKAALKALTKMDEAGASAAVVRLLQYDPFDLDEDMLRACAEV